MNNKKIAAVLVGLLCAPLTLMSLTGGHKNTTQEATNKPVAIAQPHHSKGKKRHKVKETCKRVFASILCLGHHSKAAENSDNQHENASGPKVQSSEVSPEVSSNSADTSQSETEKSAMSSVSANPGPAKTNAMDSGLVTVSHRSDAEEVEPKTEVGVEPARESLEETEETDQPAPGISISAEDIPIRD